MSLTLQGQLTGNLGEALAQAARAMRQATVNSQTLTVAQVKLKKIWEDSTGTYDEAAQKLHDVRNRADEFGATLGEQQAAIDAAAEAARKYNKPLAITARFMEELVIETQNTSEAMGLMDKAMAHAARNGLRVEEAVAEFVDLVKGRGQAALHRFGAEGEAAAKRIAAIEDPQKRATEGVKEWERLSAQQTGTLGKLNGMLRNAQGHIETFLARLGPVGTLLGVGTVATLGLGAALGGALVSGASSAIQALAQVDKRVGSTAKRVEQEWEKLKAAIGGALLGGGQQAARQLSTISQALMEMRRWISSNKEEIRAFVETGIKVAAEALKALYNVGIQPIVLGLAAIVDSIVIPTRLVLAFGRAGLQVAAILQRVQGEILGTATTSLGLADAVQNMARWVLDAFKGLLSGSAEAHGKFGGFLLQSGQALKRGLESSMNALGQALKRIFSPAIDLVRDSFKGLGEIVLKVLRRVAEAVGLDEIMEKARKGLEDLKNVGVGLGQELEGIFNDSAIKGALDLGEGVNGTVDKVRDLALGLGTARKPLKELGKDAKTLEEKLRGVEEALRKLLDEQGRQLEVQRLLATGTSSQLQSALDQTSDKLRLNAESVKFYLAAWNDAVDGGDRKLAASILERVRGLRAEGLQLSVQEAQLRRVAQERQRQEEAAKAAREAEKKRQQEQREQERKTAQAIEQARRRAEEATRKVQQANEQAANAALAYGQAVLTSLGQIAAGTQKAGDLRQAFTGGLGGLFGGVGSALGGRPGGILGSVLGNTLGSLLGSDRRRDANASLERSSQSLERAANAFLAGQERQRENLYVEVVIPGASFDQAVRTSVRRNTRRGDD